MLETSQRSEISYKIRRLVNKRFEPKLLDAFRFSTPQGYERREKRVKSAYEVQLRYKSQPKLLREVCANKVDERLLPDAFSWTIEDVCSWMDSKGFSEYNNCVRSYCITGRKLILLCNASILPTMNIRKFADITKITREVRKLFSVEDERFDRSISLPNYYPETCYKYFRSNTGTKYETSRQSEFYWKNRIIEPPPRNLSHWEVLSETLQRNRSVQRNRVGRKQQETSANLIKADCDTKSDDLGLYETDDTETVTTSRFG